VQGAKIRVSPWPLLRRLGQSSKGSREMTAANTSANAILRDKEHVSLCEVLDRLLDTGVVVAGQVIISVADIDLICLDLRLLLASVETANKIGAVVGPLGAQCTESNT